MRAPKRPSPTGTPRTCKRVAEMLVQPLAVGGLGGLGEARPQPPAGVAVERELADAQRGAADVEQRAVHAAALAVEHAQPRDLVGQLRGLRVGVARARRRAAPRRPAPISPTTSPSTETDAELTRWMRARTPPTQAGPQPVAVQPVVRAVRPHPAGQRHVAAAARLVAELLERAAQAEVRVVVGRVALHDGRELARRVAVAAAAEVGAAERLADRASCPARGASPSRAGRWPAPSGCPRSGRGRAGRGRMPRDSLTVAVFSGSRCGSRPAAQLLDEVEHPASRPPPCELRGTCSSPAAPMITTSFWSESKPMSGREMSFTTIASRPLRVELVAGARRPPRRRARRRSRRSAGPRAGRSRASESTSAVATGRPTARRGPPW